MAVLVFISPLIQPWNQNDLKLVTTNSKIYNPPGSIYYTEADRIEVWALDHIAKAASTVIQYETDWNIDIEKDDVNIDDDDDDDNPLMSVHLDDVAVNGRSLSVASQMQQSMGRRGLRGPNKKNSPQSRISDSIDSEGRLPGSREGIGAFPPCSDWTRTMVALKLKGAPSVHRSSLFSTYFIQESVTKLKKSVYVLKKRALPTFLMEVWIILRVCKF